MLEQDKINSIVSRYPASLWMDVEGILKYLEHLERDSSYKMYEKGWHMAAELLQCEAIVAFCTEHVNWFDLSSHNPKKIEFRSFIISILSDLFLDLRDRINYLKNGGKYKHFTFFERPGMSVAHTSYFSEYGLESFRTLVTQVCIELGIHDASMLRFEEYDEDVVNSVGQRSNRLWKGREEIVEPIMVRMYRIFIPMSSFDEGGSLIQQ